jgi:hypothetical protein
LNSTFTPASLNQPFWIAISHATQPGQSLYAIFRVGPVGAGAAAGAAELAAGAAETAAFSSAGGGGAGLLQALNVEASRMKLAEILWEIIIGA